MANFGGLGREPQPGSGAGAPAGCGAAPREEKFSRFCAVLSEFCPTTSQLFLAKICCCQPSSCCFFCYYFFGSCCSSHGSCIASVHLTGSAARPAAARTSKHDAPHDALGLAVFAAHAVRQHTLCAAERRLTVTPLGAQKRPDRTFPCLFDRLRGHRLNEKCSQLREKPISAKVPTVPTQGSARITFPLFWPFFALSYPSATPPRHLPRAGSWSDRAKKTGRRRRRTLK